MRSYWWDLSWVERSETPVFWPPDVKNWLNGKYPDASKDWRQEKKGMTEDELVRWHHRLYGHEFGQALGVGDGQGSLAYCSPWGCKESDTTEWLKWTELNWTERSDVFPCMTLISELRILWKVKGNLGDQWRGCCSGPVIQLMTQLGWWLGDFKWLASQDIFEILSIQFGDGLNIWYEKKKKGGKRHQGWFYGFCPETVKLRCLQLRWGSLWIEKVLDVGGGRH